MNNVLTFPDRARAREEASLWLARLDGDLLSADEALQLRQWLAADSRHREALLQLLSVFSSSAILASLPPTLVAPPDNGQYAMRQTRRGRAAALALSLSLACVAIIGWIGTPGASDPVVPAPAIASVAATTVYTTVVGEQRSWPLTDDSTLTLNTDSHVELVFDTRQRTVRLLQGEAYFAVAEDPTRPFVVFAGNGMVRAVGTEFSVRLAGDAVDVTVTEGEVAVATEPASSDVATLEQQRPAQLASREIRLRQGETVRYVRAIEPPAPLTPTEIARKLSWQQGFLVFEGQTLAEATAEIERYTDKRIVVAGEVASLRIGGYFKAGDIDATLRALESNFPVRVAREDDTLILLSARTDDTVPAM